MSDSIAADPVASTVLADPNDENIELLTAGMATQDLQEVEVAFWLSFPVREFIARHTTSGVLSQGFQQLLDLQDDENPHFAAEVVGLFFEDTDKWMAQAEKWIEKNNRDDKVDTEGISVRQMLSSAHSMGAEHLCECLAVLRRCKNENGPKALRCAEAFVKVKEAYKEVKEVFEEYLQIDEAPMRKMASAAASNHPFVPDASPAA